MLGGRWPGVLLVSAPAWPGVDAGGRLWPDPLAVRTVTGFFTVLADVRVIGGLTHQAVGGRSAGRISAGTVSRLLNCSTIPATWGTTAVHLWACGVPGDQITQWQAVWQRLRTQETSADAGRARKFPRSRP